MVADIVLVDVDPGNRERSFVCRMDAAFQAVRSGRILPHGERPARMLLQDGLQAQEDGFEFGGHIELKRLRHGPDIDIARPELPAILRGYQGPFSVCEGLPVIEHAPVKRKGAEPQRITTMRNAVWMLIVSQRRSRHA